MSEQPKTPSAPAKLVDELKKMENEPMLPIENQLIIGSLVLGVVLLGFLLWVSKVFFPGG